MLAFLIRVLKENNEDPNMTTDVAELIEVIELQKLILLVKAKNKRMPVQLRHKLYGIT